MADWAMKRWYQYRRRSIKMKKSFCTIEEFRDFWNTPKICSYCNIPDEKIKEIYPNVKVKVMTVDRKNGLDGYTKDNICWACFPCNMIKSFSLNYEEMVEVGKKYIFPKWQILKPIIVNTIPNSIRRK